MTLLVVLDYGLIVLFFGFLAALILVIARSEARHRRALAPASSLASATQPDKSAYGLVAVLFIVLIILTLLSKREKSRGAHP